jgi:cytochrome c oxidase subunit IV
MSLHVTPARHYVLVFLGLMVLTAITIGAAFVHLGPLNNVVALAIAGTKASLVVMIFMGVRHSTRMVKISVVTSIFFLVVIFLLLFSDYETRGMVDALAGK